MRLGAYEVLAEIGRGGMGSVYRARDPSGREVALKLLHDCGPEARARFEREQRIQSSLGEAEGFVPLLATGDSERGPFIVMPLLAGGTLRDRLRRGPLPVEATVALAHRLAAALAIAHARGVIHRDLTPQNVLFDATGRPLISDLGLAKHFRRGLDGASRTASLSAAGEFGGTVGYMAPEQIDDARSATPAADVFSLGAILYECLAGAPPFVGTTILEVLSQVNRGSFAPLARVRPDAPTWLRAAIERALARDPRARFVDGLAFQRALVPLRGSRALVAGAAVTLVALAGLGVLAAALLAPGRPPAPPASAARPAPAPKPVPAPRAPTPDAPGPPSPPSPLLGRLRDMLSTPRARLASIWGTHAWKAASCLNAIDVSADGRLAVSVGMDPTIMVWDLPSGELLRFFPVAGACSGVALCPDGETLLTGESDGAVRLRDLSTGAVIRELLPRGTRVRGVKLTRTGRVPAVRDDGTLLVAELASPHVARFESSGDGTFEAASLSPDGRIVAVARRDGSISLMHFDPPKMIRSFASGHRGPMEAIRFSPDGRRVLTTSHDGTARLTDVEDTGALPVVLAGHTDQVIDAVFSPGGERIATTSRDGTVRVWDASGREEHALAGHIGWVFPVAFTPDGERILSGGNDGTVRLWDARSGRALSTLGGHAGYVSALAFSADGARAITGGLDGVARVWDARSGLLLAEPRVEPLGAILAVALAPDGKLSLATSGSQLHAWDLRAEGPSPRKPLPAREPLAVLALSADGRFAFSGSAKGRSTLWDLELGGTVWEYAGDRPVRSVALGGDGLHAFSGDEDGSLLRWDLANGSFVVLRRETQATWALTADAGRALTTGVATKLWDLADAGEPRLLDANPTVTAALSPDGRRAVTAGRDMALRVWDTNEGVEIARIVLGAIPDFAARIVFAPDGRSFLVGTKRGVVLRFELD